MKKISLVIAILFTPLIVYSSGFGTGGTLTFELSYNHAFNKVKVTDQGKIYAVGYIEGDPEYTHNQNMLICRFNPNGTLDSSFANDGVKVINFTLGNSSANDLVILSAGSVVLVGDTFNTSTNDVALAKLTVNGDLDLSFGSNGTLRTDYKAIDNQGIAIVSDDSHLYVLDGCQVAVPSSSEVFSIEQSACIIKYDMQGNIVQGFGLSGFKEIRQGIFRPRGLSIYDGDLYTIGSGVKNYNSWTVSPSLGYRAPEINIARLSTRNGNTVIYETANIDTAFEEIYWASNSGLGDFYGELSISEEGKIGVGYKHWRNSGGVTTAHTGVHTSQDFDSIPHLGGIHNDIIEFATAGDDAQTQGINNFHWLNNNSFFINYGTKVVKCTGGALDTTFGIGGEVELGYIPTDIAIYDSERVMTVYSSAGNSVLRVFNSDGSPYISSPPVITSSSIATGEINVPFEYTITATNDPTQFNAAPIPSGLYLDYSDGIAKILGTPTESGTFAVNINALNSGGSDLAILTIHISNTAQVIQFNNPGAQLLGSLPIDPAASSSSNLAITYEVVSGPAAIINGNIFITGLGDIEIKATQPGNSNFEPADPVTILFTSVLARELPVIDSFPSSKQSLANSFAIISVVASGPKPLSYRWFKNGTLIDGEEDANLILSNVSYFDEAKYQCEVSNSFGETISAECDLNVTASEVSSDTDNDGLSDSLEIYLGALGLDPSKDSTNEWNRIVNLVQELGLGSTGLTLEEVSDLRAGSTMIAVENGQAILSMEVEQSDDLEIWTSGGTTSLQIPVNEDLDTKFFRFKMAD